MAKADVIARAKELGIEFDKKMTVAQIQELINAAEGATGGESPNSTAPTENPEKYIYPVYDLWKVDVEHKSSDDDDKGPKTVKFTAVKIIRHDVKLETQSAERLNAQSHNSLKRYYLKGTVQNGHEETVTVK